MSLFSHLCLVEKNISCYPDEVTAYEKFCIWFLRNVYGVRYWREIAIKQASRKDWVCIKCNRIYEGIK